MNQELITRKQIERKLKGWSALIKKDPLWYQTVVPQLLKWEQQLQDHSDKEDTKNAIYQFFGQRLEWGQVYLANHGSDFDQWRKPIDTAVIHYTGGQPGISWQTLSAIGFLRQYAHDFTVYDDIFGISIKGQPIWSGHFRGDQQVFYAYHWLVRLDGSFERLLDDKYIGWHAGSGEVNSKSVGIVLDGEFVDVEPPEAALDGIISILKENYPNLKPENILGHREVNPQTVCPGNLFLPVWKQKILDRL